MGDCYRLTIKRRTDRASTDEYFYLEVNGGVPKVVGYEAKATVVRESQKGISIEKISRDDALFNHP